MLAKRIAGVPVLLVEASDGVGGRVGAHTAGMPTECAYPLCQTCPRSSWPSVHNMNARRIPKSGRCARRHQSVLGD